MGEHDEINKKLKINNLSFGDIMDEDDDDKNYLKCLKNKNNGIYTNYINDSVCWFHNLQSSISY